MWEIKGKGEQRQKKDSDQYLFSIYLCQWLHEASYIPLWRVKKMQGDSYMTWQEVFDKL